MSAATPILTPPGAVNYDVEKALLGALLHSNAAFDRVADFLRSEHFADPANAAVYTAMRRMIESGKPATVTTLKGTLEREATLADIGGAAYLARLAASMVTVAGVEHYGRIIADLARRRALHEVAIELMERASSDDLDDSAERIQEDVETRLFSIAETGAPDRAGPRVFAEFADEAARQWEEAYKHRGKVVGVPTGLKDLDQKLGGLRDTNLIILAGRPGMGKTALSTAIAVNAARTGRGVAFFSLEMGGAQLAQRIIAAHAGVSNHKAITGQADVGEMQLLLAAKAEIADLPIHIDDGSATAVPVIRSRLRRLSRRHDIDLLVVDYIGLAKSGGRTENRVNEIAEITGGLKAIAKEMRIPVLALSQLSRAVESRDDKRPQLADLRDSGSVEQDADVVMFVYREQYYLERSEPVQRPEESAEKFNQRRDGWGKRCQEAWNTAEVIVAKQRHGPIGTVKLYFDGQLTKFGDLARGGNDD